MRALNHYCTVPLYLVIGRLHFLYAADVRSVDSRSPIRDYIRLAKSTILSIWARTDAFAVPPMELFRSTLTS